MTASLQLALVVVLVVMIMMMGMVWWWRRSRGASPERWSFPNDEPLMLGGQVRVRWSCTVPDVGEPMSVELMCFEHAPGVDKSPVVMTPTYVQTCPHRVLSEAPTFEVELDVMVPVTALPSMDVADHRIWWQLAVNVTDAGGREHPSVHRVVVAPQIDTVFLEEGGR